MNRTPTSLLFSYDASGIARQDYMACAERLVHESECIEAALPEQYDTAYAPLCLAYDAQLHRYISHVVQEKRALRPHMLIVIGIGGSNLGTMAVQQALGGLLYNEADGMPRMYYADTIDSDYLYTLIQLMKRELEAGRTVMLNVVSKSGTTTETVVNFELLLEVLKQYRPHDYAEYVVVTTDYESPLWKTAESTYTTLEIPKMVGGRYSVLSAVGLFPLGMLGLDVAELIAGAQYMQKRCLANVFEDNPAMMHAAIKATWYKCGVDIHALFLFDVALRAIGDWYRQLMGESIGKRFDRDGDRVNVGITPTVAIGTTDLHSLAQLYLGGPINTLTTFVIIEKTDHLLKPHGMALGEQLGLSTGGRSLTELMKIIAQAVQISYRKEERPFCTIVMPERSAFYLGQFLQFCMFEMMYLGRLLHINPFDQPQVELYKTETRRLLHNE